VARSGGRSNVFHSLEARRWFASVDQPSGRISAGSTGTVIFADRRIIIKSLCAPIF
jgi:hypothetical protein